MFESINEEDIFRNAIQFEDRDEQANYVKKACGNDIELRKAVEALLQHHHESSILDAPALESGLIYKTIPITEEPGNIIGRYKLLEKIGEGGMAVVYMAEQQKPIRRKVALKIIKLGMDTKSVIARFEAERQALAMMDHPNIAKVLDAGATETGRPYFVMDLVPGLSITEYCDKNRLSIKERLKLFITVCDAVQHAHQKGIIHRDVKPSNVMVTLHGGKPVPKMIDFGIAKATNQRLTEKTLFTRYAQMIGTPAYMSPEQAELSDLDVDTRTDIYSLGVLLYELLTGSTPFSEDELRKAGYLEMQRIICEKEPTRPSTKLSTLGEALTDVAKWHSSSPELMPRLVRGDLDWIVMRSLEKDRTRRYDTASALALDVQRHLSHEPVLARAPRAIYRLQKFLRRHRSQTVASLVIAVLIVGMIVILSIWNQNRLQLAETESLTHRSILSQARESLSKGDAAAALKSVKSILNSKHVGSEAQLLYAGILVEGQQPDEAMSKLGDLLDESPDIAGAAHSLLARILWEGESSDSEKLEKVDEHRQKAQELLEELLDERPEISGAAHSLLARILWESESSDSEKLEKVDDHRRKAQELLPDTAEAYFLRAMTALTIKEKFELLDGALRLDPGHYESRRLRAFTYYASRKYERMKEDALVMVVLRPRDPLGYSLRAIAFRELGHYEDAIADYDSAIRLTPEQDPQRTKLYDQRCQIYLRMGDYQRVIADAQDRLKISSDGTILHFRIFCAVIALGNYEEANALYHRIHDSDPDSKRRFRDLSMKYVFDTLDAGRSWHPLDSEPDGTAFLAMLEAEETYHKLTAKGERLMTDGFAADWSPDGTKLAFSLGVPGYSGVAIFDPASQETDLLIAPGKNPKWSPDGQHIAFIRDRQILPLSELASTERRSQSRSYWKQELWIMKADGTEPRRLAHGRWPSWSRDSKHVYNQSFTDQMLYSISVEDRDAEPKPILSFPHRYCSVSPDEKYCAYAGGGLLKIVDMASQSLVADWREPLVLRGGNWSPKGHEFSMGGYLKLEDRTGLWIYDLEKGEAAKVLCDQITDAAWAPDGTKLAFSLGPPFYEIWVASLDPSISTIEALGPGQTMQEHYQEMVDYYTRIIEADPEDAEGYLRRAQYYHYLHDEEKVHTDMGDYRAILNPQKGTDGYDRWLEAAGDQEGYTGVLFGTPTNLGPTVNSSTWDVAPNISADGLELFFFSTRPGGSGQADIWVTTRDTIDDEWGTPMNLGSTVNSSTWEVHPCVSADGLELYFGSHNRPGGLGHYDLYVTTRETTNDDWGIPVNLGPTVNSSAGEWGQSISADGLELYFGSIRPGGYGKHDLYVTKRATLSDPWGAPVNLGPTVNSSASDGFPSISTDGLTLFFSEYHLGSSRPGGYGSVDIWMTTRATKSDPWGEPVNLGPTINSSSNEDSPNISADGSTLYFDSMRSGGWDLWQAPITPMSGSFQKDGDADLAQKSVESNGKEVVPRKNR